MLNQIILVGRLVKNPDLKEIENGKKVAKITLAVPRSYKNVDGEYETDFIECTLWSGVSSTVEYCKKNDIIGVKGRIQSNTYEKEKEKKHFIEIIAEKVTFLSNNKEKEQVNN